MIGLAALAARPAASAFGERRPLLSASTARAKISLVQTSRESGGAIGVDASIPMARARCCVTISSGAFGLHCATNHAAVGRQGPPRQSEQYLVWGVNTNPSPLQFAQGAADAEVSLVAKQGWVCR